MNSTFKHEYVKKVTDGLKKSIYGNLIVHRKPVFNSFKVERMNGIFTFGNGCCYLVAHATSIPVDFPMRVNASAHSITCWGH